MRRKGSCDDSHGRVTRLLTVQRSAEKRGGRAATRRETRRTIARPLCACIRRRVVPMFDGGPAAVRCRGNACGWVTWLAGCHAAQCTVYQLQGKLRHQHRQDTTWATNEPVSVTRPDVGQWYMFMPIEAAEAVLESVENLRICGLVMCTAYGQELQSNIGEVGSLWC